MIQYSTIEEYFENVDEPQKAEFKRVQKLVKELVPDADESISYGMPAFKYKNQPLLYFGVFKDHLSLFPTSGPTETLKDKLKDYKTTKGTIQFKLEKPIPDELVKEIIETRLAEIK